ncbi:SRPBCC family protein [Amycolatopsis aidingensis]|uniref:SRPBCC family protein n=1 Tax=Amycolatopsis aidingensis TaxID=2842453 RepID=UPI001C0AE1CA|nr:SRPBCC family protein [Amycolatopsis aidingensis]
MTDVVEQTIRIEARPETVWEFFTDPELLAQWWGPAELEPRRGGPLRVPMLDGPRPVMRGEFVELVPHERIVFTFGWEDTPGAPAIEPGASLVEVTLRAEDRGTVLTLRHSGLPTELAGETGRGWAGLLRGLSRAAAAPRPRA